MGLFTRVASIDPAAAAERAERAGAIVVDVREPNEWSAGHIPGAIHIPLGELAERIGELPTDRPIIAACRSGARSATATKLLTGRGLDVTNLEGGTRAWHAAGLPLEPAGGHVA